MFGWFKKLSGGSKGRSALLTEAEERLVTLIPIRVKALGIREPVYCLRIWYYGTDTVGDRVPTLMLAKESARKRLVTEKGAEVPHYLWCADELTRPESTYSADIKDAILSDLCRKWYDYAWGQQPETEELRPIREMVQRVAKRLNALPWRKHVPVTDDFVVFAADASHTFCADYDEMRASVPTERIDLLRSRRLLGTDPWWSLERTTETGE